MELLPAYDGGRVSDSDRPMVTGGRSLTELREFLEGLHDQHNRPEFIAADPISVPHMFSSRDDREIAGFLVATISWGTRRSIVADANRILALVDHAPADFVRHASAAELERLRGFVHRTFNGRDLIDFVLAIRGIHERHGGIGRFFEAAYAAERSIPAVLRAFRREFLSFTHHAHSEKHISSVEKGSACKRLNMYLRWFVRSDDRGVDFGLWRGIPMSALYLPLDTHTAAAGRALGLLSRRRNDWKATAEITRNLRLLDPEDPVRFDFALFGWGAD
jgi:uncharacterized protein (TIGR02757 family)